MTGPASPLPVRATISDMGALLLARLLNLNATQEGVLSLAFKIADDNGFLLLDLKDLSALLRYVEDNAARGGRHRASSTRWRRARPAVSAARWLASSRAAFSARCSAASGAADAEPEPEARGFTGT